MKTKLSIERLENLLDQSVLEIKKYYTKDESEFLGLILFGIHDKLERISSKRKTKIKPEITQLNGRIRTKQIIYIKNGNGPGVIPCSHCGMSVNLGREIGNEEFVKNWIQFGLCNYCLKQKDEK